MSRVVAAGAGLCVLLWVLAGCGNGSDREVVQVEAAEYTYEMPDRIDGGLVTMEFVNAGDEVHEWRLGRLKESRTGEDLGRELLDGMTEKPASIDDVPSVPALTPGATVALGWELEPGEYVFFCSLPTPNGTPHYQRGMIRSFAIEGTSDAAAPEVDGRITARETRFDVRNLGPGTQTLELENASGEAREFNLLSLEPGEEPRDLQRWVKGGLRGEPPADLLGIIRTIPPGGTVYATLTLETDRTYYLFDDENAVSTSFRID